MKKPSNSAVRSYRKRVKHSYCRGLRGRACNKKTTCKYVSGKKRTFCRKTKNLRRVTRKMKQAGGMYHKGGMAHLKKH